MPLERIRVDPEDGKMISTTQLAKSQGCSTKEMFARLLELGLVTRENDVWTLTDFGKQNGGVLKKSKRFGDYITWPSNLSILTVQNGRR